MASLLVQCLWFRLYYFIADLMWMNAAHAVFDIYTRSFRPQRLSRLHTGQQ